MVTTKPDLTRVWASGASAANVVDPDTTTPGKFAAGWLAEIPPFEHFNFLQQFFTEGLAYNNEQGVNEWDTNTTYPINGIVKGSNGSLYIAISEQSGNDPVSSPTFWRPFITLTVDTVGVLRETIGTQGQAARALGYTAKFDGGVGPGWHWDEGQAPGTYVHNGISVLVAVAGDGSEGWLWDHTGPVNALWGGVKAGTTDSTAAMQIMVDLFEKEQIYLPYSELGYKLDALTKSVGGSSFIDFRNNAVTPFTTDARLINFIATTFDEISITNLNADAYERTINVQCDSIVKFTANDNTISNSGTPIRLFSDNVGYTSTLRNIIDDTTSVIDGDVLAAISVGKDIDTLGIAYVQNNKINNVDYTFAAPAGIDVHGVWCTCEEMWVTDNYINSITTTAPTGVTGCEAIYTKALTMHVDRNTIIDGGQEEAAITIKGSSTSELMSTVIGNIIAYDDSYVPIQAAIKVFRDNIKIADNYIKNVTDVAIVTAVSNTGNIGVDISSNTIVSPRGKYAIQCSHNGVTGDGNKIIRPKWSTLEWGAVFIKDFTTEAIPMNVIMLNTTIIIDNDLTTTTNSGLFVIDGSNDLSAVNINGVVYSDERTVSPTRVFMIKGANFVGTTRLDWNNFKKFVHVDASVGADLFDSHGDTPHWTGQPTVGTYEQGEKGYYRLDTTAGFEGWICSVSGVVGAGAVFKNFGAIV